MATKALTTTSLRLCGDLSFCCDPQNSTAAQQLQSCRKLFESLQNQSTSQFDSGIGSHNSMTAHTIECCDAATLKCCLSADLLKESWPAAENKWVSWHDNGGIEMGAQQSWLTVNVQPKYDVCKQSSHVEPQRMPLWREDELLDMLVVIKFIKKIPRDFRPARSFCS